MASAAAVAGDDGGVEQVIICTPDKDLGQCVRGTRVVQLDRRKDQLIDEGGVVAKFGVGPTSIPDYLALVGDSADGFPGLAGWGAKSAAAVLARWDHIEDIPGGPGRLGRDRAGRRQARGDAAGVPRRTRGCSRSWPPCASTARCSGRVDDLRWRGPTSEFARICEEIDAPGLARRAEALARGALEGRAGPGLYLAAPTTGAGPEKVSRRR